MLIARTLPTLKLNAKPLCRVITPGIGCRIRGLTVLLQTWALFSRRSLVLVVLCSRASKAQVQADAAAILVLLSLGSIAPKWPCLTRAVCYMRRRNTRKQVKAVQHRDEPPMQNQISSKMLLRLCRGRSSGMSSSSCVAVLTRPLFGLSELGWSY